MMVPWSMTTVAPIPTPCPAAPGPTAESDSVCGSAVGSAHGVDSSP